MSDLASIHYSARRRAAKVITACYDGQHVAHDLLDAQQADEPLSSSDAALTTELVIGVLRHLITCEHIAARYYRGRWIGLRANLRVTAALGIYQLCWLDRIPDHAAVDQSVQLAKFHGKGAAATVNAILRKVIEIRGNIVEQSQSQPPRRYMLIDETRARLFDDDVFPDPARKPLDHIVAATGHPMWLVERWHRRFKPVLCRQICEAGSLRPKLVLRANTRRITPSALLKQLCNAGRDAQFVEGTEAIIVRGAPPVTQLPEFIDGLCQPQDSTAQLAVQLAAPKPGETVLDICAGIGTKSTQAAELMDDKGIVIATDIDDRKLVRMEANAARLGLTSIKPVSFSSLSLASRPDVILVDAPCTNTGVLARRPEARYRASQKNLTALVKMQREILQHALRLAGSSTRLVYSTCSIETEENEDQVAWLIKEFPEWRIVETKMALPDRSRNGGFVAVLRR